MRTGAGFHADEAGRQLCDQRQKMLPRYFGLDPRGLAVIINAMRRKDVLGQIDSYGDNAHGLPLSWCANGRPQNHHFGTPLPYTASAAASGRGSPFNFLGQSHMGILGRPQGLFELHSSDSCVGSMLSKTNVVEILGVTERDIQSVPFKNWNGIEAIDER